MRGDSEPGNSINTYRPCTKGYRKTTKLAKGSSATKYLGIGAELGARNRGRVGGWIRYGYEAQRNARRNAQRDR